MRDIINARTVEKQQEIGCKEGLQYTPRNVHIKTL